MRKIVIALCAVLVCSVSAVVHNPPNYNKLAQAVSDNLNSDRANARQSLIQKKLELAQCDDPQVTMEGGDDMGVSNMVMSARELQSHSMDWCDNDQEYKDIITRVRSSDNSVKSEYPVDTTGVQGDLQYYKSHRNFDGANDLTINARNC